MPDCHVGYALPIGGVVATKGVVLPYFVGFDGGCGVAYVETNIKYSDIYKITTKDNQSIIQAILSTWMRNIPVGFNHHKTLQDWSGFDSIDSLTTPIAHEQLNSARYQLGTLGSGNHFLDITVNQEDNIGILIHSGSRNLGYKICSYYYNKAKELNEKWHSNIPQGSNANFLPMDDEYGHKYFCEMNFACEFALQNRHLMMERCKNALFNLLEKYGGITNVSIKQEINIHHNYANYEHHYGENVIVHRKGAIQAKCGQFGLIPGSMGTNSYVVRGKGNQESFESCSHGAGRSRSRKKAKEEFSVQDVIEDMKKRGIILFKANKNTVAEECPWSYKDVDAVIENQKDLTEVVDILKPIGVLMS